MRVGNSSKPASRSIILNLLNNFLERRNSVQRLRIITNFLKESLKSTIEEIEPFHPQSIITPIDLRILKDTLVLTEWFLSENQLMGGHLSPHSQSHGVYTRLRDLELLNLYIQEYNSTVDIQKKIKERQYWHIKSTKYEDRIAFWDGIVKKTDDFLSKF
jgi:hypothetical protein